MTRRDGHIRVLPLHVANKIAAGEVVERPASVVKELVENAIDAGAGNIRIAIAQGGRKLVSVQDDGCGMTRDDAVLSLERQATSKILDVNDIEEIDTLGFRGEAIPSIASVSRFTLTTRRRESDEGTALTVNAGTLAEVTSAGCPPGTLVEVRDLFCNVPARRKFLRAYATEESHVRSIFTVSALAYPGIGFSLTVDGHEVYRLAACNSLRERVRELFGPQFIESVLPVDLTMPLRGDDEISVTGYIERPNLSAPTRHDQHVFINGRPASAPSIAAALRETYPRRAGDARPAAILFIRLPPKHVDVNVHPTKREVRFRDTIAVRNAVSSAIENALLVLSPHPTPPVAAPQRTSAAAIRQEPAPAPSATVAPSIAPAPEPAEHVTVRSAEVPVTPATHTPPAPTAEPPRPAPVPMEFAIEPGSRRSQPWQWFKFLAVTDSGVVTLNPHAARERIAYESLMRTVEAGPAAHGMSQALLIPETVQLSPVDFSRVQLALPSITAMGFSLEPFGRDTFKIDAIPQLIGSLAPAAVLATIARDLAEGGTRRGERWREELIAKSIARSFAGASLAMTREGAIRLVEELCACRMPYVCPRGRPVMIFTSTRELNRKFERA